ncbi:hypothetical protein AVDCRST_MAG84-7052 [uncultured Microcoleus sp.]|uniref:Uncharacterized protein n=1 Tax=uncultured Microcoleus sp. TaxID=259945 RepID=A0A6J4PLH0_9CYAN|nr:hypothetical protein AVDCRST_MAG84-7052 [uncultured Microcoleus sp.]
MSISNYAQNLLKFLVENLDLGDRTIMPNLQQINLPKLGYPFQSGRNGQQNSASYQLR